MRCGDAAPCAGGGSSRAADLTRRYAACMNAMPSCSNTACQPAAMTGAGSDTDAVCFDRRRGRGGMAVHHDHTEILLAGQKALADTEQIVLGLTVNRQAWPDAGIDEQVIAFAVAGRQAIEKCRWPQRHHRTARSVRCVRDRPADSAAIRSDCASRHRIRPSTGLSRGKAPILNGRMARKPSDPINSANPIAHS